MNDSTWFKSSYSTGSGNNCLEASRLPHAIHVRDSKLGPDPQLAFDGPAWATFIAAIPSESAT
ncbi:DUF397 domain-containing protein [Streptomyces sp. I05A-00742]|uniref:DUF397 domain-containing protein n=1 Tax=Streptomyces sp. I05A-00742 TaxID=2732853 RepID=UPI00148882FE|nr:DUF397 domain-containing protein [Streptomyces sp. I05A-00742]